MGRIGRYSYPDIGPEEAVEIVQIIHSQYDGVLEQEDRNDLANQLKHDSADSGAFKQKLAALKKYDLLEGRGTLSTTSLADRLGGRDEVVYISMLKNVDILYTAYSKFNREIPELPEWESFIESYADIEEGVEEIRGSEKLLSIYKEFVDILPEDENYLDKGKEFDYYDEKLANDNTRSAALEAIKSNVRRKKLADSEVLNTILDYIKRENYPDDMYNLYQILLMICENNDVERLESGKKEEIVKLLLGKLAKYTEEDSIDDTGSYRNRILDTLEVLHPDKLVDKWWHLLIRKLKEAAKKDNKGMRDFAKKEIGNRLMRADTEVCEEFYESKADEAEDELWKIMAETNDEDLRGDCEQLLKAMGVL